jgi:hypothetical protein
VPPHSLISIDTNYLTTLPHRQLTFPGTSASLPTELGTLTDLQSLSVIGNGVIPGGSVPGSFGGMAGLTTLHLESTGLGELPDALFSGGGSGGGGLGKIQTVQLVKNGAMGGTLPGSLFGSSIQNL